MATNPSPYAPNFADQPPGPEGFSVETEGGQQAPLTPEQAKQLEAAVRGIISQLEKDAFERVTRRTQIENRWIDDLSQYHGKYTEAIKKDLQDSERSQVFLNQTRPKTNAMEARLSDMLFPTDDRNWGISPTPVPELTVQAEEIAKAAAAAKATAVANPQDQQAQDASARADEQLSLFQAEVDEARKRARLMEEEIDDALRECNYSAQARDAIRDACRIGTGVIKGPVTDGTSRRSWQKEQAENVYKIVYAAEKKVSIWRVDPWNFFPDHDATKQEESESDFERHLLNPKQLRKLARQPGFNADGIRRLLQTKPQQALPTYLARLRSLTGTADMLTGRYHVWEYHGSIDAHDLEMLALALDPQMLQDIQQEPDPLEELKVVLWFCQGECLKLGIYPLDSGDSLYDVFNLERDEASVFGFGVPYLMRDSQSSIAGAWRMVMDNMGLTAGPQIVINREAIEPADGKWTLKPRKVWLRKPGTADQKPFEVIEITSALPDLMTVLDASKRNIDEETALPLLAQGEQGAQVTKTAGGMSMLMNSVNVVFRRIVKNWDDLVTTPLIRRVYDWQMQFSTKDYIKGDFNVDARGTSVLLVREMQTANLLAFLVHFANHPTLGKYLKEGGLPALRRYAQVLMMPQDEVVKSDQEVAKDERDAAGQPPKPDAEMEKIAASLNLEEVRGQNALKLEEARRETGLIILAGKNNMTLEELKVRLWEGQQEIAHKERAMAVEAAVTQKQLDQGAPTGGGSF